MGNKSSSTHGSTSGDKNSCSATVNNPLFECRDIGHHGLPSNTKVIAFDQQQGLLAVGTSTAIIKVYGRKGIEVVIQNSNDSVGLGASITKLAFNSTGKLVSVMSDSGIRIWDLSSRRDGYMQKELAASWTLARVTAIEVPCFSKFPYIYIATDDGNIHIMNTDTCVISDYNICLEDLGHTPSKPAGEETDYATAIAINPTDENQLLIGFEFSGLFLWDLSKRRVVRKYSLGDNPDVYSTFSLCGLAWNSTGKKFAVVYAEGLVAIFRAEKNIGHCEMLYKKQEERSLHQVQQVMWSAPDKRYSNGAIVVAGGDYVHGITILYEKEEAQGILNRHSTWHRDHISSPNNGEVINFSLAYEQERSESGCRNHLSCIIMLAGNPMDGVPPYVWVQPIHEGSVTSDGSSTSPLFLPPLLQDSSITAVTVVDLDGTMEQLRTDLQIEEGDSHQTINWPIDGGSIVVPTTQIITPSVSLSGRIHSKRSGLLVTAHASGIVRFWNRLPALDQYSKGSLSLLHQTQSLTESQNNICCLAFCPDARILAIGCENGNVAILEFCLGLQRRSSTIVEEHFGGGMDSQTTANPPNDESGFRQLFALEMHSARITHMALCTAYNRLAVADEHGSVSLIDLNSGEYKLVVFELAVDEVPAVTSLTITESLVSELDEGQGVSETLGEQESIESSQIPSDNVKVNIVPVLLVGKGNGMIEKYHLIDAKKLCEISTPNNMALTQLIPLDVSCSEFLIRGRPWAQHQEALSVASQEQLNRSSGDGVVHVRSPSVEMQLTREAAMEAIAESGGEDRPSTTSPPQHDADGRTIDIEVPPGPLGLYLNPDITDHAVVHGFAKSQSNGLTLERHGGVHIGSRIVGINGIDVSTLKLAEIRTMLEKLRENSKIISFLGSEIDASELEYAQIEKDDFANKVPHFMIAASGRSLFFTSMDHNRTEKPMTACAPLAAAPLSVCICSVPIKDQLENIVLCADKGGAISAYTLPSLKVIWRSQYSSGLSTDFTHVLLSNMAELIFSTPSSEILRTSLLSPQAAAEFGVFQLSSVQTLLHVPERSGKDNSEEPPQPKRRSSAGSIFKRLVGTGHKDVDLEQVFEGDHETEQRKKLLGEPRQNASDEQDKSKMEHAQSSMSATKKTLAQATEALHERGDKLSNIAEKTEEMKNASESFYQTMKAYNEREANKKWWQI